MAKYQDNTNKILQEADSSVRKKLTLSALVVERRAKMNCPVDTGALRRSITHELSPDGKTAVVGSNMEYAAFVELGTSKMAARPYLKLALIQSRSEIKRIFRG